MALATLASPGYASVSYLLRLCYTKRSSSARAVALVTSDTLFAHCYLLITYYQHVTRFVPIVGHAMRSCDTRKCDRLVRRSCRWRCGFSSRDRTLRAASTADTVPQSCRRRSHKCRRRPDHPTSIIIVIFICQHT